MTMTKHVTVDIRVNEATAVRRIVPAWELPILQAVHGTDGTIAGEELIERDPPAPHAEMERLTKRYKNTRDEDGRPGAPWVEGVYGSGRHGLQQLAAAIKQATVEGAEAELSSSNLDLIGGSEQVSSVVG